MYQALYRKFRPDTFDQVLGQEHITTTLKNQIIKGNVGHAYLFCGTRGTGKTSTAKILARAVNCLDTKDGNPCNECDMCKGIINENIMDVIEMDAASNNSVEDVRELREKVKYPPSKCKYKVYIIDEVHMLSKGAFNALLKTLEEPPSHLIFILATTEVEKLPQTILSRCQRFDFKRVGIKNIFKNMKNICNKLNVDVEDKILNLIARNSDGAMRDALSLLDQCISFSENKLTYEDALSILGIVNNDLLFNMVDNIKDKDLEKVFESIDELIRDGKDINQFIKDLIYHFRNLMIVKTSSCSSNIIDLDEDTINRYKVQVEDMNLSFILNSLDILNKAETQSKWSSQPRIILEMSVINLMDRVDNLDLEKRIEKLENIIKNGDININENKVKFEINSNSKTKPKIKPKVENKDSNNKLEPKKEQVSNKKEISKNQKKINFSDIKKEWSQFLKIIKKQRIGIYALLVEGEIISLENNVLNIIYKEGFGFHKEAINKKENKQYLEKTLLNYFHANIKVEVSMENEIQSNQDEQQDEKIIKEVVDVFGEDIVKVKK